MDRFLEIVNFVPETFWVVDLHYRVPDDLAAALAGPDAPAPSTAPQPKRARSTKREGMSWWSWFPLCRLCILFVFAVLMLYVGGIQPRNIELLSRFPCLHINCFVVCFLSVVRFDWTRGRLFDHLSSVILFEMCVEDGVAVVESICSAPKSKWQPLPLSTVDMYCVVFRSRACVMTCLAPLFPD